jgi:CheY-like chemotaxis protein
MLERQINHMVRLVDDLLEVSRISRGKITLRREPVELAGILGAALETSEPLIQAAGHQVDVFLPPETLIVEADPVRLAQVFAILIDNAAKYCGPGGKITVTAVRQGAEVRFSIRDNGIGISAEMLPVIFQAFVQVDRSISRTRGGLGIGLTLAKEILDLHGGRIEARSDGPGKGSEFVVWLPAAAEKAGESAPSNGPEKGTGGPAPMRVLVVDDNRDAANSLGLLLKWRGVEVHVAHEGVTALEALESFRPEVVLLDLGLPGMDGYEVAQRIRRAPDGQRVVLIALTGWSHSDYRRRSSETGFNHHLVKPVDFETLMDLLTSSNLEEGGWLTES